MKARLAKSMVAGMSMQPFEKLVANRLVEEDGVPPDIAESMVSDHEDDFAQMRQRAATSLDDLDIAEDIMRQNIDELTSVCLGVRRFSTSIVGRVLGESGIEVYVCGSEALPEGPSHESVHVVRQ